MLLLVLHCPAPCALCVAASRPLLSTAPTPCHPCLPPCPPPHLQGAGSESQFELAEASGPTQEGGALGGAPPNMNRQTLAFIQ